jgi:citrate lyase subunit beta / citryl-CoA lyase
LNSPAPLLTTATHSRVTLPACEHIAGNLRFASKAIALLRERLSCNHPIFDITLDLEDGAPIGRESLLREEFGRLIEEEVLPRERLGVRIHPRNHPDFEADLVWSAQFAARLSYITVPKVADAAEVVEIATALARTVGPSAPALRLHILVETAAALRDADRIAAHPIVDTLDFGIMDYVSEHTGAIPLSAIESPGQFDHPLVRRAKLEISAAALGRGKVPSHNVTLAHADATQTENDARRAGREFGYLRMWSIHPHQIDAILRGFFPEASEVVLAKHVLEAAKAANWGPISYEGKLYDRASYRYLADLYRRAFPADGNFSHPE